MAWLFLGADRGVADFSRYFLVFSVILKTELEQQSWKTLAMVRLWPPVPIPHVTEVGWCHVATAFPLLKENFQ